VISAALCLLPLAGLWTALQTSLGLADTTRAIARSSYTAGGETSLDLDNSPGASLGLREGRFSLLLGYAPDFILQSPFSGPPQRRFLITHSGFLYGNYQIVGAGYRLSFDEAVTAGTQIVGGPALAPANPNLGPDATMPRVNFLPAASRISTINEVTTVTLGYDWTPRLQSGISAAYMLTGGLGEESSKLMPLVRTATLGLSLGYRLLRDDTFGLATAVSDIRTSNGHHYWTTSGKAFWTHLFSDSASSHVDLGAQHSFARGATADMAAVGDTTYLIGSARVAVALVRGRAYSASVGAGVSVTAVPNTLTGELQQTAQESVSASMTWMRTLTVQVGADAGQTLPLDDPRAIRVVGVSAGLAYTPDPLVDIRADYRTYWQSSDDPIFMNTPRLWYASLSVVVRAPSLRF
jgi:hypothetical protein